MIKPLQGVRVLDFTRFFAGPYCAMLLGDYGADVVKIESMGGDEQRLQGPPFVGDQSPGFMAVNRNKKSVVIDLKTREGLEIARELIKSSDIVLENFKKGAADRLGIGYRDAVGLRPDIIYCSINGYGDRGPHGDTPAYDLTVQAFSGFMSMNGLPEREPVLPGVSIGDLMAGVTAFAAIEGALLRRAQQTEKEPQHVHTSLFETIGSYLTDAAVTYWLTGQERKAKGSFHANLTPYGAYKARDGYIAIAAGHTHMFKRLCEALHMDEFLADESYMDTKTRYSRREEVKTRLEACLAENDVAYWTTLLKEKGIPASEVNSLGEALDSPQSEAVGLKVELEHEIFGTMYVAGPAAKQPGVETGTWTAPPALGQHTAEVLRGRLGLDDARIAELIGSGAVKQYT